MPLKLRAGERADISQIVDCLFDAYSHPRHPYCDLMLPGAGTNDPQGKPYAIRNWQERWDADPNEQWMNVVDTDTDRIIGISRWVFYPEAPFPNGPPRVEAKWYPEGSLIREYTSFLMNDRLVRQAQRCQEPNAWLGTLGVCAAYRRRGVAKMLVQWGVQRADELGIEAFVEASFFGSHVYRQFGFQHVEHCIVKRPKEHEGNEEWKHLEENYPLEVEWLWRPKRADEKFPTV